MSNVSKLFMVAILVPILAGCANTKRDAFVGVDQVDAVTLLMLAGTWEVKVMNPRKSDPPMLGEIRIAADGTTSGSWTADFTNKNELGKVVYDIAGKWSVNGNTISQKLDSVDQTSGSAFAAFGVNLNMGLRAGQTTVTEVYEASENHLIIVNEKAGVARYYTRTQ